MVFDPDSGKMHCEHCGGFDCETQRGDRSVTVCASCGGEISAEANVSATKCPYCGNHLVFDERVEGSYEPEEIIPFTVSKNKAIELMKKTFKKRTFAPKGFLSSLSFRELKGNYVPFFLYDYDTMTDFDGVGTKVKTWTKGNTEYTETSYYRILRKMRAKFSKVPADATFLADDKMDLLEPFAYERLVKFMPKFMSGFEGYIYDFPSSTYEPRIKGKISNDISGLLRNSYSEFSGVRADVLETDFGEAKSEYALLPVWTYFYKFGDKTYDIYVNGVTGKVVGKAPVSKKKVLGYSAFFGAMIWIIGQAAMLLLEVIR